MRDFLRDHCWDLLCVSGVLLVAAGFWHFSRGLGLIFLGLPLCLLGAWAAYAHARPRKSSEE